VCSVWTEESSFYSGEGRLGRPARFAMVAVGPGARRAKAWALSVGDVHAVLTRLIVGKTRHYSGGDRDGSLRVMAEGRGSSRRLRRSRGPASVSRRVTVR
jgi:hypothetical protein